MKVTTLRIAILSAIISACSAVSEPRCLAASTSCAPPDIRLTVLETQDGPNAPTILPFTADVVGGQGQIEATGNIRTPTPCYALEPRFARDGSDITVVVSAKSQGGICAQVLVVRRFSVVVGSLPAGSYRVKVLYEYVDSKTTTETVADKTVVVK